MLSSFILRVMTAFDSPNCASVGPDLFFPDISEKHAPIAAKRVCNACAHKQDCLEVALQDHTLDGIWGGTTSVERRAMRRAASKVG